MRQPRIRKQDGLVLPTTQGGAFCRPGRGLRPRAITRRRWHARDEGVRISRPARAAGGRHHCCDRWHAARSPDLWRRRWPGGHLWGVDAPWCRARCYRGLRGTCGHSALSVPEVLARLLFMAVMPPASSQCLASRDIGCQCTATRRHHPRVDEQGCGCRPRRAATPSYASKQTHGHCSSPHSSATACLRTVAHDARCQQPACRQQRRCRARSASCQASPPVARSSVAWGSRRPMPRAFFRTWPPESSRACPGGENGWLSRGVGRAKTIWRR